MTTTNSNPIHTATITATSKSCRTTEAIKAVKAAILAAYPHATDIKVHLTVREGREDCGSGALLIDGAISFAQYFSMPTVDVRVASNRSTWRNYGHPSGTLYAYDFDLAWQHPYGMGV